MSSPTLHKADTEVLYDPLRTAAVYHSIELLHNVVRSCYGPRARLKALLNANNTALSISSASSVLYHRILSKNPFVKLVISCAKSRRDLDSDCGLLIVLLTTSFVLTSLDKNVPKMLFADLNDHIAQICLSYLESNECKCNITVDMSTITNLRSVVKSVLCSKPGCVLSSTEKNHIGLLILKAFLNIVPTSVDTPLGNINIVSNEGPCPTESKAFSGVLIDCPPSAERLYDESFSRRLKLILFVISLSGDAEFPVKRLQVKKGINVWNEVLNLLRDLGRKLIELNIDIVSCQKVIHPVIKEQLQMKGIMVLDRLGSINAQAIQQSTGARPVQTIFLPDKLDIFGYVDTAQIMKIGEKSYINLGSTEQVWTLLLCHSIPACLEEMKIVCRQAIDALSRLVISKKALFGAGCMETGLAAFVNMEVHRTLSNISKMYRCAESQVLTVADNFINVLHNVAVSVHAGKTLNYMTDSIFYHLWEATADRCTCGQFTKENLPNAKWIYLDIKGVNTGVAIEPVPKPANDIILDEYSNKLHAYRKAFDLISLLLRTGTCIIDKT